MLTIIINITAKILRITLTALSLWLPTVLQAEEPVTIASSERPNILLILADDLGYSDIASYGSEISTPNLDELAQQGLRFSRYYTTASCAPTRAMLLTGVDSHRAGVANIAEALTPEQSQSPFYRGTLNHNVVTIATLLKEAGYHTNLAGKWHLGYEDKSLMPSRRGFEQTVMMPFSGGDNWTDQSYLPLYRKTLWFENGEEITLPKDFYSSQFIVDKAIAQIEKNRGDDQPFFSYIAFQAVHIPVQAPREYTEKYLETYQAGWSVLRQRRQQAVKDLGLIAADAPVKTMNSTQDWDGLSAQEQRFNSKRMAVYAGMVDAMDFNIGRLLDYLKSIDEYDNTMIIFTSDNGPEPSDPYAMNPAFPLLMGALLGHNNDYDTLGERYSYNSIGVSFASAAAAPFGHYKFHAGEGGMRVPMIISGPSVAASHRGSISDSKAFVKDLASTILAMTDTEHPGTRYEGKTIEPATGKNLLPLITGVSKEIYGEDDIIAYEIGGNAALIKGDYKIVLNRGEFNDSQWHLYNIAKDPGETDAIEASEALIFADLVDEYARYAQENGVIAVPENYRQVRQVSLNGMKIRLGFIWQDHGGSIIASLLLIVTAVILLLRRRKITA
ncbi:Arylsulfatase [Sinobacterium norvegicum]|uniref:Arylsulfatase n=1 Tax=Sinobacterium norvegicum TaxID=1641715 RepID=A0ABM9ACH5_9GAMM|nr:arylsulfatase [Sinobacterium norvegicum]CAH0990664.1 Arylsulfatase [Sinobacterium norvegicum]